MDKKYDHVQSQELAQQLWQSNKTYKMENNPGPIYSIDTPPPTISGSLHIGHVFSYTQTDIIAHYKRMSGFSVFYPFGFDDNGLPTERFVEKKLEINAHSLTRSEFIKLCLQETAQVETQFQVLWQQIGLSVDWDLCYSTIDNRSRYISQASFIELYKKGFIYRKEEPALYCTTCRTTVAQAELEDAPKSSYFNDIIFKTTHGNNQLIIGTTRPELLSSCVALFYHPEDSRYTHLKGQTAQVPIYNYSIPILEDTEVDPDKGTGLVMCATFGDKTDITWFKKYKLPYRQSIGLDGKWTEHTGPLANMRVATARETILKILEEQQLLLVKKAITHNVNVHERCKKEIEYLVLPQWFLLILPFKQEFLELADNINWYPSFMKARYKNWVENISWDWCLSRQRFYGIPFPVWHCTECKEVIIPELADLPLDPQEAKPKTACTKCGSQSLIPDTDVMDTWNTSSLTPYICMSLYTNSLEQPFNLEHAQHFIPMSMRPQAHDIIRTWAFYTIVKAWMHNKTIAWKNIVISGHVLSTEKEKISKSQGNSPLAPESLLKNYPADAIRYWTASGTLGHDMAFSETQLSIGQKLLVKLWNAFKFAYQYLEHYQPQEQTPEHLGTLNQWLLHNASACYHNYTKYFEVNEFGLALDAVEKFFWNDLCDNYLELIKDQLTNPANYTTQEVQATLWTLYNVGLRILQLYAPFVPHVTETIYGFIYQKHMDSLSIHQTRFTQTQKVYNFPESVSTIAVVLELIGQVRRLKTEAQISLRTDIETLTICSTNPELHALLRTHEALIKGVTKAITIAYTQDCSLSSGMQQQEEKWYAHVAVEYKQQKA